MDLKIPLLKMADKYVLRCQLLGQDDQVLEEQAVNFRARE